MAASPVARARPGRIEAGQPSGPGSPVASAARRGRRGPQARGTISASTATAANSSVRYEIEYL